MGDGDDDLDWTPPPNKLDKPPPLARCSSTSSTSSTLVTTSVMSRNVFMAVSLTTPEPGPGCTLRRGRLDA